MIDLHWRPSLADMRRLGGIAEDGPRAAAVGREAELEAARRPRTTLPGLLAGRTGYAPDFLDFHVGLPAPVDRAASDVLPVAGDAAGRLDYLHFTVVMSRSRKLALYAACNVEGAALRRIGRTGDPWALDGRTQRECMPALHHRFAQPFVRAGPQGGPRALRQVERRARDRPSGCSPDERRMPMRLGKRGSPRHPS